MSKLQKRIDQVVEQLHKDLDASKSYYQDRLAYSTAFNASQGVAADALAMVAKLERKVKRLQGKLDEAELAAVMGYV